MRAARLSRIAVVGAHCDDIAIGAGASLLAVCTARAGLRVDALVLSGAGTAREDEERGALRAFCPDAELRVSVLDLPDGRMPARWEEAKSAIAAVSAAVEPDVVFAPHPKDAHQDHRLLGELVPTEFRDHLVLGYEIVKSDGDLHRPSVYQPLTPYHAERKAELLLRHYPSQSGRPWFDSEAFLGLARIRGVECQQQYAEAFHVNRLAIDLIGG